MRTIILSRTPLCVLNGRVSSYRMEPVVICECDAGLIVDGRLLPAPCLVKGRPRELATIAPLRGTILTAERSTDLFGIHEVVETRISPAGEPRVLDEDFPGDRDRFIPVCAVLLERIGVIIPLLFDPTEYIDVAPDVATSSASTGTEILESCTREQCRLWQAEAMTGLIAHLMQCVDGTTCHFEISGDRKSIVCDYASEKGHSAYTIGIAEHSPSCQSAGDESGCGEVILDFYDAMQAHH